jgi:serine protease AprX
MQPSDLVIQTTASLSASQVQELADLGLRITYTLAPNQYRVRGEGATSEAALLAKPYVVNVTAYSPDQKIDAALMSVAAGRAAGAFGAAPMSVRALVLLDPNSDPRATVSQLTQIGSVIQSTDRRVLVDIPADQLQAAAALHGVLAIEPEPENRVHNNVARGLIQLDAVAASVGLDGGGEIVGVSDSGLDNGNNDPTLLADFRGRVVNIRATVNKAAFGVANGADLNNHGTHVCGSILGDGSNSNGKIRGMAPAARLTMLSMGPNNGSFLTVPFDLVADVFQDAYVDGARIHSNSWGSSQTASFGKYDGQAQDVDEFMRDNRDILILFAAGNEGANGASTVTPPGTAKNCLTVGASESQRPIPATVHIDPNLQDADFNPATPKVNVPLQLPFGSPADNPDDIAAFSSRGPTNDAGDSRIKPDLVAPGTFILSCRSSVSTADLGPDGVDHANLPPGFYADDKDGVATHPEAVGLGLPGAPFFGTWNENTPDVPPGSGSIYQQNYFYDSGTSMATPITAGATALLRQYLRQRRGLLSPSGALIKALLVNGAMVPAGQSNVPDNARGFGWLNLETTIRPAPTGQQSYSDDIQLAVATNDIRHIQVQLADPAHPFRVTMAYTDHPGRGLQNRLYLRVITPGGATIDGDVTVFPTASNNVQRVHIDAPAAGLYTIEVHGIDVTHGIAALLPEIRQDFALAIINGVGVSPRPVDIVHVIDHSGSMGFYGYMEPAKERAKQLVDMLRVNDRAGVVAFDNTVTTVNGVVPITGAGTQTGINTNIDAIAPAGSTSIGGGLQAGQAGLASGGDPGHPQAIVLLSDGHENTPPWAGGVPNSPPGWYGGPDFTEALSGIPATTKIYTVSLGVQSDQPLLQSIAAARGGTFHAVNSPADIGSLHEIYVHLQALTGGEEVIGAGTDMVSGVSNQEAPAIAKASGTALQYYLSALTKLREAEELTQPRSASSIKVHRVFVDETVSSVAMIVSWHDRARPVLLTLISPSGKVINAGSVTCLNRTGSSYQFFRIESPEIGEWQLRVETSRKNESRIAVYTWGAYGTTPIGLRVVLPKRIVGARSIQAKLALQAAPRTIDRAQFNGVFASPKVSLTALLEKHARQLKDIKLVFDPDKPNEPSLYRLAALEIQLQARGRPSLFEVTEQTLQISGPARPIVKLDTSVPGTYKLSFQSEGKTQKGNVFRRRSLHSLFV